MNLTGIVNIVDSIKIMNHNVMTELVMLFELPFSVEAGFVPVLNRLLYKIYCAAAHGCAFNV